MLVWLLKQNNLQERSKMKELYLPLDDIFIKDRQCSDARTPGTNDCPARNPFSLLIGSFVIQHEPWWMNVSQRHLLRRCPPDSIYHRYSSFGMEETLQTEIPPRLEWSKIKKSVETNILLPGCVRHLQNMSQYWNRVNPIIGFIDFYKAQSQ